jgi:molybdenum cofactor synthesis domain-containing protein
MELELFEKTEIWVRPIRIRDVNLNVVAERVAEVLNLKKEEVMVIDVREDVIALDIMKKTVNAEDIIGKKEALLQTFAAITGVNLTPDTSIHAEGILGLIEIIDQKAANHFLKEFKRLGDQISDQIRKRAIIFPSGIEIQRGFIKDTNSPYIKHRLTEEGFKATIGDVLEDNLEHIVPALRKAIQDGFGLIITTGGVGAENKDRVIEALLRLDPRASTPYIIHYEKGTGRHEKDGVKIGVAYLKPSFIIALPGPHEEVKIGVEIIVEGLKNGWDKETLALALSEKYIQSLKKIHHSF